MTIFSRGISSTTIGMCVRAAHISSDASMSRAFADQSSRPRINLMHSLWVKLFGYVIHPSIPRDSPDLRVADVGSGTG